MFKDTNVICGNARNIVNKPCNIYRKQTCLKRLMWYVEMLEILQKIPCNIYRKQTYV